MLIEYFKTKYRVVPVRDAYFNKTVYAPEQLRWWWTIWTRFEGICGEELTFHYYDNAQRFIDNIKNNVAT